MVRIVLVSAMVLASAGESPAAKPVPSAEEATTLKRALDASESLIAEFERHKGLFARRNADQPLQPQDRDTLLRLWATIIDYELGLDSLKARYTTAWFGGENDKDELKAFLVAYSAYMAQLRLSMTVLGEAVGKPAFEKLLNEASPEHGLAAGHLDRLKKLALSAPAAFGLRTGWDYLRRKTSDLKKHGLLADGPFLELVRYSRAHWKKTDSLYWRRGIPLAATASLTLVQGEFFKAFYPAQAGVAGWMGDTKVRRNGKSLITHEQLEALRLKMEPGDILVERRNWYLSNLGLPGFWPHAELYTGTPEELAAYFDADPEVLAQYPQTFSGFLKSSFPAKFETWASPGHEGQPHRILEAISEGVVFTTLDEAALADYVGVMRPRLSKLEKARAIARAFAHHGKPYDFDFDFLTDQTLVCTELVFKSYRAPAGEGRSLNIPLVKVAGRTTLPANEIVRLFDQQYGTDKQQLDFVAFLDGREFLGKAVESELETFRASHKRIKWDIVQE